MQNISVFSHVDNTTFRILLSDLYHITLKFAPSARSQGVERGVSLRDYSNINLSSIRTLQLTSVPVGDAKLSTPASNIRLARFTNALATPPPVLALP